MSKTLTFEIPEELYEAFDYIARRDGKTTEQVALEYLARRAAERRPPLSDEERQAGEHLDRLGPERSRPREQVAHDDDDADDDEALDDAVHGPATAAIALPSRRNYA